MAVAADSSIRKVLIARSMAAFVDVPHKISVNMTRVVVRLGDANFGWPFGER